MNILKKIVNSILPTYILPDNNDKLERYWTTQTFTETILLADNLYKNKQYIETYEILNKIQYCNYGALRWRLARVLYHLTQTNVTLEIKKQMINEAYNILNAECTYLNNELAEYYKWLAIISDAKYRMEGFDKRVKNLAIIKQHLIKAIQLNQNDFTLQYLLGRWCYLLTSLNQFQKIYIKYFINELPSTTYSEAYKYLLNAENLKPRTYIPNILLLGQTCIALKKYHQAKYYLNLVVYLNDGKTTKENRLAEKLLCNLGKETTMDYGFVG